MGTASGNPTWEDYPSTNTPQSAQALNNIEQALDRFDNGHAIETFWTHPKPGWSVAPLGVETTSSGTHVQNKLCLEVLDIRRAMTPSAFYAQVSQAVAGGTDVNVQLVLYASDDDGWPDCTKLLAQGSLPITSGGHKIVPITVAELPPGRYWVGGLYTYTTAPTTPPRVMSPGAVDVPLPYPSGKNPGAQAKGLNINGLTALPTTEQTVWDTWSSIEGFAVGLRI